MPLSPGRVRNHSKHHFTLINDLFIVLLALKPLLQKLLSISDTENNPSPRTVPRMCYQVVERYSVCRCLYYKHAIDPCAAHGQRGHMVQEKTVLCSFRFWLRKQFMFFWSLTMREKYNLNTGPRTAMEILPKISSTNALGSLASSSWSLGANSHSTVTSRLFVHLEIHALVRSYLQSWHNHDRANV
ncbi:hypothetical protein GGP41_008450 [Bipolaris sorokiniana]|uniref:Uncharacterized protein n=1 Tax=Cochliobolus sativus TaxID=45130 RepID=A0A8H5Z957_COCSA|nr:hypothetical protein GGP41_008450 [Bipolaris sorokiniana]